MLDILKFGAIMTLIDTIWIRTYMLPKYKNWFSSIGLNIRYNYVSIFLAYFMMILVYPLLIKDSNTKKELIKAAFVGGAIFGLYAFTVCGIFPNYGLDFAFTELVWGVILYTSSVFILKQIIP